MIQKISFGNILENGYKNSIPEKDGVIDTIKSLHYKGYEMAVASSNSSNLVEEALKRLGDIQVFCRKFHTRFNKSKEKPSWILGKCCKGPRYGHKKLNPIWWCSICP